MGAVYANASNQIAALKELYTGEDYMKDLVYKKNPFFALVPKDESPTGFAGKYIPVPIVFGTGQGRSHSFSNAQGNQTAPQLASFFVYRVSDYQVVTITNELLEATAHDAGAFVDEAKLSMDTGFRNISNNIAGELFRSGTASRGQIGSYGKVGSVVTIQLADPSQVNQFEVGMTLVACATDGGAPSSDTVAITSVNRTRNASGGYTIVGTASTGGGALSGNWATNGYLVVQGDLPGAGASSPANFLAITGLAGWLPATAPSSGENFWGVDRSVDSRLYGFYWDASQQTIEEGLIDACSQIAENGGQPDYIFLNFVSYAALEKSLGSKVQYVSVKHDEADIAFAGITINAPYGPVTVIPDRNCQAKTAYVLEMETWKLRSLGKVPHVLTYGLEGLEGLRVGNADALEIRIGFYGNLICSAPGWNGQVKLSS